MISPRDDSAASVSSARGAPPPRRESFPAYPATWYRFGAARELARPVSKRLLGRQLVGFRTAAGHVAVLAANCAHLGADLGCGRVVGETIQCPFHHWSYGVDGRCRHIPGTTTIPPFARQAVFPAVERHGQVFFFNGPEALFPLPFFPEENPADFVAADVFSYESDCNWYTNAAHGFDTQHFAAVHERRLLGPPLIDCPEPFARRNTYRAEVLERTRLDRVLRRVAGRHVEISITNWGGAFVVITGRFDRATSRFIITTRPLEQGGTQCEGIVYAPRSRNAVTRALVQPIALRLRRWFTRGYVCGEAEHLRGTDYNPATLIDADRDMVEFFHWVTALPQSRAGQDIHTGGTPLAPVHATSSNGQLSFSP